MFKKKCICCLLKNIPFFLGGPGSHIKCSHQCNMHYRSNSYKNSPYGSNLLKAKLRTKSQKSPKKSLAKKKCKKKVLINKLKRVEENSTEKKTMNCEKQALQERIENENNDEEILNMNITPSEANWVLLNKFDSLETPKKGFPITRIRNRIHT